MQIQLLVFVTVVEKKNFSRAAESLNMTQPAVSQQIHSLEDHYGVKLFERNSKRVELTRAGEILHDYAVQILNLHQEARQAINDLVGLVTGKLMIGASLTIGEYVLPRLLAVFTRQFPDVEVAVSIGNTEVIADNALNSRIDVGLVEGPVNPANLMITPFLEDEMVLIVPSRHRLASVDTAETSDLSNETFIVREVGSGTRYVVEEVFRTLEFHPKREIQFGSTQAIKEAVEAGLGVAFISKWSIQKEIQLGTLSAVRVKGHSFPRPFSVIWKKGQFQTRAMKEFVNLTGSSDFLTALEKGSFPSPLE
ncbi:selenium metabolism-associated LysR family transcriptional regulator [Effusibacillus lacus]|uniref:Transcriptional regulator n=1 Tax=Effusibacillus lacus TaxID=1348429 RepID=A0A292YF85_9BACL|nr:selenium metabolism-associated LysR family transcriptional regulator [Effusibacillus lacus]TCS74725.1 DNA-binding transcriptional LysR family regulator [Effusibacillus lacus]GAX88537.1 transcriptional regulator [Effusibacillus lacus]